jgi:LPS-assembly protein
MYGDYAAQPQLGFLTRREGVLPDGSLKLTQNWVINAGVRYDLEANAISQTRLGFGYIDDCFIMSFTYFKDFSYSNIVTTNNTYMFQLSLRTIGEEGNNGVGQQSLAR